MRQPLVAGNWKMHGSRAGITELVKGLNDEASSTCERLICPPSILLDFVANLLTDSSIKLGAQNADWHSEGAFTGEISPAMVAEAGCQYCIVGHSERRSLFGESDDAVAAKVAALLGAGVSPLVCVGESLAQRESDQTRAVVLAQLEAVIAHLDREGLGWPTELVVAYEPVWAIGTGRTATPEQADQVHAWLRERLSAIGAGDTRILYGGSVKADNAEALFACEHIDGALVGGASLKAEEFNAICRAAG